MPPDLVLLVCDTARADAFTPWGAPYRTPVMDRLCREGLWFAEATATAPWTLPSTASIFTGVLPAEHGATGECFRWVDRRPTSPAEAIRGYRGPWLTEELAGRGYRTWGASCNSWVSAWGGFDRGFETFVDLRPWARARSRPGRVLYRLRKGAGLLDRGGREASQSFAARLAAAGHEPLFAFVNLMETHAPLDPPVRWYPFAPWRRPSTKKLAGGPDQGLSYNARVRTPSAGYVGAIRELYRGCAQYEDWLLGRFVRAIEERNRPTVLVITADHGENLGEHGMFNHNSSMLQSLLRVPLVAWGHRVDVAGGGVAEPVSLLKLAGWVTGLADGDGAAPPAPNGPVLTEYEGTFKHNGIPDEVRGSIEAGDPAALPPLILHPGLAVRKGHHKYVAIGDGRESLFDLAADPGEDHDLLATRPEAAAEFAPFRDDWQRRQASRPEYDAGEVAEGEIAEHLRTLGYIE